MSRDPRERPWWRRPTLLVGLTAVLVMGIGLRAAYLKDDVDRSATLYSPLGEGAEHQELARQVANGSLVGPEFLPAEPLYPLALGGWQRLVGPSPTRLAALQALLGLVILGLTFWLGLRVASAEVGVLAAGLLALYGPLLHFESKPLPVTLAMALHLLALIAAVGGATRPRAASGAGTGLLFGALTWARPWLLLVPIFRALGGLPALWRQARPERRRRLVRAGWVLAGLAVVLTPLYVRNAQSGAPGTLLPARYGLQLYAGNHPTATGVDAPPPGFTSPRRHWFAEARQRAAGGPPRSPATPAATSRHYADLALRATLAAPGAALARLGRKALRFGLSQELRASTSVAADRQTHLALRLAVLPFSLLLALGILGLVLAELRGRAWLLASLAAHLAYGLVVSISSEARITLAPVLAVAAGAALLHVARHLGRRPRVLPATVGAVAVAAALTLIPLDDARRLAGEDRLLEAQALLRQGRPWAAREALQTVRQVPALTLEADRVDAAVAQQLGRHPEAIGLLRRILARSPRSATTHTDLARSYLALAERSASRGDRGAGTDQLHEALSHLEKALALQPHHVDALLLYAQVSRAMGRLDQAESLLRRALAAAPAHAGAHLELAILLALRGDLPQARAHAALARLFGARLSPQWKVLLRGQGPPPAPSPR